MKNSFEAIAMVLGIMRKEREKCDSDRGKEGKREKERGTEMVKEISSLRQ